MSNTPSPPVDPADLPAGPAGALISAWGARLLAGQPLTPRAAMLLMLHVSYLRWEEIASDLQAEVEQARARSKDGLASKAYVTPKIGMYKDRPLPQGEEIRALVLLEGQERDRLARLAKEAHALGISDEVPW